MKPLRVGELAKRTGLTVRALHHYDEIGLLTPSHRTAAGYRLYDGRDVVRLQHLEMTVESMRGRRVDRVRLKLISPETMAAEATAHGGGK